MPDPGASDPVQFDFQTAQRIVRAVRTVEQLPGKQTGHGGGNNNPQYAPPIIRRIRNDSGADREKFHILCIDGPVNDAISDTDEQARQIYLKGITPGTEHPCVLLQDCRQNDYADFVDAGLCIVNVDMLVAGQQFVECVDGDATKLQSVASGGVGRIEWVEDNEATGEMLAVVTLGEVAASSGVSGPAYIRKLDLDGTQVWAKNWQPWAQISSALFPGTLLVSGGWPVSRLTVGDNKLYAVLTDRGGGSGVTSPSKAFAFDLDTGELLRRLVCGTSSSSGLTTAAGAQISADDDNVAIVGAASVFSVDHSGIVTTAAIATPANAGMRIGPDGNIYTGITNKIQSFAIGSSTAIMDVSIGSGVIVRDIAFASNGDVIIVVESNASTECRRYTTGGSLVWGYEHGGNLVAVAVDEADNVLVGGTSGTGGFNIRLLDDAGSVLWSKDNGDSDFTNDTIFGAACDGQGGYYVTGLRVERAASFATTIGTDLNEAMATTRKFDISGNLVWSLDHGADTYAIHYHNGHLYLGGAQSFLPVATVENWP